MSIAVKSHCALMPVLYGNAQQTNIQNLKAWCSASGFRFSKHAHMQCDLVTSTVSELNYEVVHWWLILSLMPNCLFATALLKYARGSPARLRTIHFFRNRSINNRDLNNYRNFRNYHKPRLFDWSTLYMSEAVRINRNIKFPTYICAQCDYFRFFAATDDCIWNRLQ